MTHIPGAGRLPLAHLIPTRADLRNMIRLSVPVVVVQVGIMLMGTVDTIMVGRVSAADLAAVALGNVYFFMAAVFGMGVLYGLDPVIAQAVGARDDTAVARGLQRGLVLSVGMTVAASALLVTAEPVLTLVRQPPEVIPKAAQYALVAIPGVLPFYAFIVLRQTLQAMERMSSIVWTIVLANLVNVGLNWVLVYGHLGFPAMGAVGTSWASSLSRWLMALSLAWMAWPVLASYLRPFRPEVLSGAPLWRMMRLGAPIGVQFQLEFGAFAAIALLIGQFGTVPVAGHQVAISIASLTFMVPLGVGAASAVLVGQAVGAEDIALARRATGAGLSLGGGFMAVTASAMLFAPDLLAKAYTNEPTVIVVAATLIPIAGIFQVFDGLQTVAAGVLRGAGDTRSPMVVNIVGFWLLGLPISVVLGFVAGGGPRGLWAGLAAGLAIVAIFLLVKVRRLLAGDVRRVVIDHDAGSGEGARWAQPKTR